MCCCEMTDGGKAELAEDCQKYNTFATLIEHNKTNKCSVFHYKFILHEDVVLSYVFLHKRKKVCRQLY